MEHKIILDGNNIPLPAVINKDSLGLGSVMAERWFCRDDLDYFFVILPAELQENIERSSYVRLIDVLYEKYKEICTLDNDFSKTLERATILSVYYALEHRTAPAAVREAAINEVQQELRRKGNPETIISLLCDTLHWQGFPLELGVRYLLSDVASISEHTMCMITLVEIFLMAGQGNLAEKRSFHNIMSFDTLAYLSGFHREVRALCRAPEEFYRFRLKNLLGFKPFGSERDHAPLDRLINELEHLPVDVQGPIKKFLNQRARFSGRGIVANCYHKDEQEHSALFKLMLLLSRIVPDDRVIYIEETLRGPSLEQRLSVNSYDDIRDAQVHHDRVLDVWLRNEPGSITLHPHGMWH